MQDEILKRLADLEKRHNRMKRFFAAFVMLTVFATITFGFTKSSDFNIIRAKGLVIQDEKGKDRILIGSPIPQSKNRVRTDTALVRKYWANNMGVDPDEYMNYYKSYKHSADGIVFLNENGFDVLQVGDNLSDANIGQRMFKCTGLIWNDQMGMERGGGGVNTTPDGKSRPTIGLDDASGEAIHLICLEDGSKGIVIGSEQGSLRIGMSSKEGLLFENKGNFTGIQYFDNANNLIWEENFSNKVMEAKK